MARFDAYLMKKLLKKAIDRTKFENRKEYLCPTVDL